MPHPGQNRQFFVLRDLEIWPMTLKKHWCHYLCIWRPSGNHSYKTWSKTHLTYFKLCASFQNHWSIQTGVTVRKHQIWIKMSDFLSRDLEIWPMILKNNRAPLLCHIKLCASFHWHMGFKLKLQSTNGYIGFWPLWGPGRPRRDGQKLIF